MTTPLPLPDEPSAEAKAEMVWVLSVIEALGQDRFYEVLHDLCFMGLIEGRDVRVRRQEL